MDRKEPAKNKTVSLRIPNPLYKKIETLNKIKPHLSMNALIVEMLEASLSTSTIYGDAHS